MSTWDIYRELPIIKPNKKSKMNHNNSTRYTVVVSEIAKQMRG